MTEPPDADLQPLTPFDEPAADELPPPANPAPARRRARPANDSARKGRHFGPRPVADPRSAWLTTRTTPEFLAKVRADAHAAGLPLSDYLHVELGGRRSPRARRNPTELHKQLAQLRAEMGKQGGLLNQGIRAANRIALEAPAANSRDRLADLLEEALDLLRSAVADHRRADAAVERALGLRLEDDHDY